MRGTPRTPRGRAALAALAVGGGVVLATAVTAAAGVEPATVLTDGTTITVTTTTSAPPPPPPPPPIEQPLTVEKSAYLFYTRVNSWDIDKWASPQAGWDKKDQSVAVDYSVKVTKSWKAVNIKVFGEITVTNPNEGRYWVLVGDELPGGTCAIRAPRVMDATATADAALAPGTNPVATVAPHGTTVLRYVCSLDRLPKRKIVNTAWIKWLPLRADAIDATALDQGETPKWTGNAKGTADVVASAARYREVNGAVKVIDTLDGDQTRLLDDHLTDSKTFTYRRYLSFWRSKKICRTWDNIAKVAPAPRDVLLPNVGEAPEMRLLPDLPEIAPEWPAEDWSKTDSATVKICPPPPPVKGEDPKPPVVEVTGPGNSKADPVVVKPTDNPKGPVVKDNTSKGRLLVSKWSRVKTAGIGDTVVWVIRVKNIGKAELYGIRVTDILPKHLVPAPSEANDKGGKVLATIRELGPGKSEQIVVTTIVKGKPAPTPREMAQARKLKTSKDRDEAVRRLRRGLVCNVARATTKKGPSDSDIACIRIVRKEAPPTTT
ncbi:MAG: DUF11 domain-containing protein [Thermoleophilia bacterium]|nr:DUF11 domain-containing protein [Thermoleophilia bacterium]